MAGFKLKKRMLLEDIAQSTQSQIKRILEEVSIYIARWRGEKVDSIAVYFSIIS